MAPDLSSKPDPFKRLHTPARETPDPVQPGESPAARAARQEQNARQLQATRNRLGEAWNAFLHFLNHKQQIQAEELTARLEEDYRIWAAFFELMKGEFQELWDFFGVIEHDTKGWFRSAPNGAKDGFLGISSAGYNFAACIEQNNRPNAPFPAKWLMVSVAHLSSRPCGIGDERMLGRKDVSDSLTGLAGCSGGDLNAQIKAAAEMKKKTMECPLVFQVFSKKVGQKYTEVPVSVLEKHSLVELCQGLFVALNNDLLTDLAPVAKGSEPLKLDWKECGNTPVKR